MNVRTNRAMVGAAVLALLLFTPTAEAARKANAPPVPAEPLAVANTTVTNKCGGCTITYVFNPRTCTLTQKADCGVEVCISIPGLESQNCRKIHTSSRSNVMVAAGEGTATVTNCVDGKCSGPVTTCDISTLEPTIKPIEIDTAAVGTVSASDDVGNVTALSYSVVWTGTSIHYQVTNEGTSAKNVFWFDTPFNGDFIAPGETLEHSVSAVSEPVALFRPLEAVDPDGGLLTFDAVTYVVPAEAPGDDVEP